MCCQITQAQSGNYKAGDTLHVFTANGLKLRTQNSPSSPAIITMKLGDEVVVENTFQFDSKYAQTIEGFAGNWIKVKYDTLTGFAFDGFLSNLPVPKMDFRKIKEGENDMGAKGVALIDQYISTEFITIGEPAEFYDSHCGKGGFLVQVQQLNKGFTKITHYGWEGGGTELVMPDVRLAEVKNLLLLLGDRYGYDLKQTEWLRAFLKNIPPLGESQESDYLEVKRYPAKLNSGNTWAIVFSLFTS